MQPLTGGTTVSGGQTVSKHDTHSTRDTFTKVGEPVEIVLQLGCFQSDAEKEADNKRMALHEAGFDYFLHQSNQLRAEMERLHKKLTVAQNHANTICLGTFNLGLLTHTSLVSTVLLNPEEQTETVNRILAEDARAARDAQLLPLQ